jgi:hypothetical protein
MVSLQPSNFITCIYGYAMKQNFHNQNTHLTAFTTSFRHPLQKTRTHSAWRRKGLQGIKITTGIMNLDWEDTVDTSKCNADTRQEEGQDIICIHSILRYLRKKNYVVLLRQINSYHPCITVLWWCSDTEVGPVLQCKCHYCQLKIQSLVPR